MIRFSPARHAAFRDLATLEDLDRCLAASREAPVIIYKHSLTCGTSAMAAEDVGAWLETAGEGRPDVYMVRVQTARAVSNEIAVRLGVRHESPQVLLVADGAVQWHASHFGIAAATIEAAVQRLAASGRR